ncbi:MAG: chemotaxis protein CheW [Dehalococcoidia bacterium]|nr:chemotaxis protein CheW [Dehalococcoidia bacterium]
MKGNNIGDAGLEVQKNSQRFEKERRKEGKIVQLIVFNLGDEEFGANIDQVREIIRTKIITPIPNSPDFIDGLTTVRGEIAVVIDLKNRFLLPVNKGMEEKHIIMTVQDKNIFGLKVDEVTEVLRILETEIKATPDLVLKVDIDYVLGVLMLKDRLIIMLDLQKVLSEEELVKLSENRIKHREVMKKVRKKTEEKELKAKDVKDNDEKMETPAQPMTTNTIQNDNDQSGKRVKE